MAPLRRATSTGLTTSAKTTPTAGLITSCSVTEWVGNGRPTPLTCWRCQAGALLRTIAPSSPALSRTTGDRFHQKSTQRVSEDFPELLPLNHPRMIGG